MRFCESDAVSVQHFVGALAVAAIMLPAILRLSLAIERFNGKVTVA